MCIWKGFSSTAAVDHVACTSCRALHRFEPGCSPTPRRTRWRAGRTPSSRGRSAPTSGASTPSRSPTGWPCAAPRTPLRATPASPPSSKARSVRSRPARSASPRPPSRTRSITSIRAGGVPAAPGPSRVSGRGARAVDPRRHRRVQDCIRMPLAGGGCRRAAPDRRPRRRARRRHRFPALGARRAGCRRRGSCSTASHRTTATPTAAKVAGACSSPAIAPAAEHYPREDYYSARAEAMRLASQKDGRFRISTLADFDGVEVAAENAASDHCTHLAVAEA
jgi:hypothetical protein